MVDLTEEEFEAIKTYLQPAIAVDVRRADEYVRMAAGSIYKSKLLEEADALLANAQAAQRGISKLADFNLG